MCLYCNCGDWAFRYDPPWYPKPWERYLPVALPPAPINPWPLNKLRDYYDLLRRVKEMEDKIGCPCEPNKADYLKLFQDRIRELEKEQKKPWHEKPITL